jgi:hypothetical protein
MSAPRRPGATRAAASEKRLAACLFLVLVDAGVVFDDEKIEDAWQPDRPR